MIVLFEAPEHRKTWRDLVPVIEGIYARHGAGCCWHIVLDDNNDSKGSIDFCLKYAAAVECFPCMAAGELFKQYSRTQLTKANKHRYLW